MLSLSKSHSRQGLKHKKNKKKKEEGPVHKGMLSAVNNNKCQLMTYPYSTNSLFIKIQRKQFSGRKENHCRPRFLHSSHQIQSPSLLLSKLLHHLLYLIIITAHHYLYYFLELVLLIIISPLPRFGII